MKLSNKVISALRLLSKSSFTPSKLRFSGCASLEIPLVIQLLTKRACPKNLLDTLFLVLIWCLLSPQEVAENRQVIRTTLFVEVSILVPLTACPARLRTLGLDKGLDKLLATVHQVDAAATHC